MAPHAQDEFSVASKPSSPPTVTWWSVRQFLASEGATIEKLKPLLRCWENVRAVVAADWFSLLSEAFQQKQDGHEFVDILLIECEKRVGDDTRIDILGACSLTIGPARFPFKENRNAKIAYGVAEMLLSKFNKLVTLTTTKAGKTLYQDATSNNAIEIVNLAFSSLSDEEKLRMITTGISVLKQAIMLGRHDLVSIYLKVPGVQITPIDVTLAVRRSLEGELFGLGNQQNYVEVVKVFANSYPGHFTPEVFKVVVTNGDKNVWEILINLKGAYEIIKESGILHTAVQLGQYDIVKSLMERFPDLCTTTHQDGKGPAKPVLNFNSSLYDNPEVSEQVSEQVREKIRNLIAPEIILRTFPDQARKLLCDSGKHYTTKCSLPNVVTETDLKQETARLTLRS